MNILIRKNNDLRYLASIAGCVQSFMKAKESSQKSVFCSNNNKIILTGVSVNPEYVRFEEITFLLCIANLGLALQLAMDVAYVHWTSKRQIHSPISMNINLSLLHGPGHLGFCRKFFNQWWGFSEMWWSLICLVLLLNEQSHSIRYFNCKMNESKSKTVLHENHRKQH